MGLLLPRSLLVVSNIRNDKRGSHFGGPGTDFSRNDTTLVRGLILATFSPQASQGETDPNNTTIFVGGLNDSVSDDHLRQVFGQFGELVHVKIPAGKHCGFVQFTDRACAEQALATLNGTQLGGQNIRLSWGRTPSSKQAQPDQSQWNGANYGYAQGYEAYGYAPPPQDPNMYYGAYPGYGNYQQPQQ